MKGNGIVVVNYNDSKRVVELINRIKDYEILKYIVVVDNNSTDNSYDILKKYEDNKIVIIKSDKNGGYGYGVNIGSKYLINKKIKNIFISNADINFEEEALESLVKYLNDNIDVGIVAPTIKENGRLNRGWKIPTPLKDLAMNLFGINILKLRKKLSNKLLEYPDEHYQQDVSTVDVVSGCFFLVDSEVLEKINFFDENLFLFYEENVLGKKLKKLQLKTKVLNNVYVIHEHSATINKNMNSINKYKIQKESQYYFHKNYNNANIITRGLLIGTNKLYYAMMSFYYKIKKH